MSTKFWISLSRNEVERYKLLLILKVYDVGYGESLDRAEVVIYVVS